MEFSVFSFVVFLFIPIPLAQAARWAIDSGCDNTDNLKSRDGIIAAVHEARDRANVAVEVMNNNANDPKVESILKMVLGEEDYDNKFNAAKSSLEGVMSFEENPAEPGIGTDEWQEKRSWDDVQMYCDMNRFEPRECSTGYSNAAWDGRYTFSLNYNTLAKECYGDDVTGGTKVLTANSRKKNFKKPLPPNEPPFWDSPNLPYTMDVCTWFIKEWAEMGFPRVDDKFIDHVMSEDGEKELNDRNEKLKAKNSPRRLTQIDQLKTMGSTLLHELTHTRPGGDTVDAPERDCYDWICVLKTKSARNADSVAMLGLALELWTKNYMVNQDGTIEKFE